MKSNDNEQACAPVSPGRPGRTPRPGWPLVLLLLLCGSGCTVYQSIGKSTGAYLHPVSGHDFVHIDNDRWDHRNALLYFYRPHSQWAADEIEAPSVYIDDRHYFNLRDGSYTWLEVRPGERHITMRRPLLGLEGVNSFSLRLIADAAFTVEAGRVYYLRYSELSVPNERYPDLDPDHPLVRGDLQLVTRRYAMQPEEIVATRFLNSDLLAPNHAGTSIVEVNEDTDYARRLAYLEKERELEIERLKTAGKYRDAPWYWPFGGGPTVPLAADGTSGSCRRRMPVCRKSGNAGPMPEGGWWIF